MIYQAYPLPPIERFPRNVHATAHYGTLNSFSKQHPLIADHGGRNTADDGFHVSRRVGRLENIESKSVSFNVHGSF